MSAAASSPSDAVRATRGDPPPFASVLCGVGAGTPSLEAARQAATVGTGGKLTLVAFGGPDGVGPEWAEIAAAFVLAARDNEVPDVLEVPADRVLPSLLLVAGRHDLLVVGAHDATSGRDDITPAIVHQCPVPVLLARPVPAGTGVTDRILVATGGPGDAALRVATALGDRHGARIETLATPVGVTSRGRDRTAAAVLGAAARFEATLIVVSSRGLAGIAGLRSVSAAVAAGARCSVLVVRPG